MLSKTVIKTINALKVKKYRKKYSEFVAEGDKIIKELIQAGLEVVHIFAMDDTFKHPLLQNITLNELQKITSLQNPSNSLAVFKLKEHELKITTDEWIVLLDDIQDPGNMGTIIRTCDWFGINKIICSQGCVDVWNPKVVQASMASVGRVQIWEKDLNTIIDSYKLPVYGAVFDGKNYRNQAYTEKGFILIGNEGHGIDATLQQKITYPITIPKVGEAESLNAAIATALILDKL